MNTYCRVVPCPAVRRFTLVEMLIVIAIIGTLAALLLPALRNALDTASKTACLNNLRQTGILIASYSNNHSGWGLGGYRGNAEQLNYAGTGPVYLGTLISGGELPLPPDVFFCPASRYAPSWRSPTWSKTVTQESCWKNNQGTVCGYTTNPNICSYSLGASDGYAASRKRLARHPSRLAMVSDWHGVTSNNTSYGDCPRNHGEAFYNYLRVDGSALGQANPAITISVETTGASTGSRMELLHE